MSTYRLSELREGILAFISVLQFIIYVASVLVVWLVFENKPMAIGIATSLTVAHILMYAKEWIGEKLNEVMEEIKKSVDDKENKIQELRGKLQLGK